MCGEQPSTDRRSQVRGGSSPRVWGTAHVTGGIGSSYRFIPACVGNRGVGKEKHNPCAVHPRVCGEQMITLWTIMVITGSSPRVWGTGRQTCAGCAQPRFIPACVGNRRCPRYDPCALSVHPRVCGEQINVLRIWPLLPGSSPRVWGTACIKAQDNFLRRFIPACVGNSCRRTTRKQSKAVHPRVCGEQLDFLYEGDVDAGSSPRVWGTAFTCGAKNAGPRFIPACVGNRSY